jgi:hypothetical protein
MNKGSVSILHGGERLQSTNSGFQDKTCALCIWLMNKFEDLKRPTVRQSPATVRLRLGPQL